MSKVELETAVGEPLSYSGKIETIRSVLWIDGRLRFNEPSAPSRFKKRKIQKDQKNDHGRHEPMSYTRGPSD